MNQKSVSRKNPLLTLGYIKNHTEDQYFERKIVGDKDSQPSKIANELIAMLNADGGTFILGVSDDGSEIQDLNQLEVEKLNRYRQICFDFIRPPATIELEEVVLDNGSLIFIYHVEVDFERVFSRKDNEDVFIRMADSCKGPLSRDEVSKLEYDKSIRSFEDEIVQDFEDEDLNITMLQMYREEINFEGNNTDLLRYRNLVVRKGDEILHKKSGTLLFSENPDKYIANAAVRYTRFDGVVKKSGVDLNVVKDERFEGCIPELITVVRKFISNTLRDYYFLDMQTGRFIQISEYPEDAWLEGLVNALTHRSYNIQGNPIHIKHFDDRLEISNSGPLPAQVTVENIKTERYSRNPRIAKVLSEMGFVRELNEGVNRIYESMEKSLLASPEYVDKNNTITLTLRNNVSLHKNTISRKVMQRITDMWDDLNTTEREIVLYLFVHGAGILKEMAQKLDVSDKTIRLYLNKFIKNRILKKDTKKQRDVDAPYTFQD